MYKIIKSKLALTWFLEFAKIFRKYVHDTLRRYYKNNIFLLIIAKQRNFIFAGDAINLLKLAVKKQNIGRIFFNCQVSIIFNIF